MKQKLKQLECGYYKIETKIGELYILKFNKENYLLMSAMENDISKTYGKHVDIELLSGMLDKYTKKDFTRI